MPSHFGLIDARWVGGAVNVLLLKRSACRPGSATRRDKMGTFPSGAETRRGESAKRGDLVAIKITIRLPHLHGMIATKPYDGSGEATIGRKPFRLETAAHGVLQLS